MVGVDDRDSNEDQRGFGNVYHVVGDDDSVVGYDRDVFVRLDCCIRLDHGDVD